MDPVDTSLNHNSHNTKPAHIIITAIALCLVVVFVGTIVWVIYANKKTAPSPTATTKDSKSPFSTPIPDQNTPNTYLDVSKNYTVKYPPNFKYIQKTQGETSNVLHPVYFSDAQDIVNNYKVYMYYDSRSFYDVIESLNSLDVGSREAIAVDNRDAIKALIRSNGTQYIEVVIDTNLPIVIIGKDEVVLDKIINSINFLK